MREMCGHKSVGMLVWKEEGDDRKLLIIERKKFPFGFAPPAGHVEGGSSFEAAARRELKEEVGLVSYAMAKVLSGRKNNPCRRGSTWHDWKVYEVSFSGSGNVVLSTEEAKSYRWTTREELRTLAERTKLYLAHNITEEEWQAMPGLEPVWYEIFQELNLL
jgi:ADP-ribose pyrophosphatase YjhB (NUDIX family)